MSGNRRMFGIRVVCFIAGMCVGGGLAGFKMQDIPAEGQERHGKGRNSPRQTVRLMIRQSAICAGTITGA